MIASLRGRITAVRLDSAILEVGGVGMLVQATPGTLAELRPGEDVTLATTLIVREDSLTLFGFASADEREVFETVQTVSGIGPRLALAMLAVHSPDGLREAVAASDLTALMRVPGIGRKGAQRLVLELTDRLGAPLAQATLPASGPLSGGQGSAAAWRDQVIDALVGLGWPLRAATEAVDTVTTEAGSTDGSQEDDASTEPPDVTLVLRAALRHLGRVA